MSLRKHSKVLSLTDILTLIICKDVVCSKIEVQDILSLSGASVFFRLEKLQQMNLISLKIGKGNQSSLAKTKNITKEELSKRLNREIKKLQIFNNFLKNGGYNQLKNKLYKIMA